MSQKTGVSGPSRPLAAVDALDALKVGQILISAGTAAALAGHTRPQSTMRDYVHPTCPEVAFVRDMFTCQTSEIVDVWYGGELEVAARASDAIASMLPAPDGG